MDTIFDLCVDLLEWMASMTGTTYKEINVIVFCLIWPAITAGLVYLVVRYRRQMDKKQSSE